jgi:hypothetical protein
MHGAADRSQHNRTGLTTEAAEEAIRAISLGHQHRDHVPRVASSSAHPERVTPQINCAIVVTRSDTCRDVARHLVWHEVAPAIDGVVLPGLRPESVRQQTKPSTLYPLLKKSGNVTIIFACVLTIIMILTH